MGTVTILEAQAKLAELIHALRPGEEVIITENSQPIARLQAAQIQPCGGRCCTWPLHDANDGETP